VSISSTFLRNPIEIRVNSENYYGIMQVEKKPNFFIIGAPKSGTTSLSIWLSDHPQVYFSKKKEPYFFNTDDKWILRLSEKQYLILFREAKSNHLAIGEGTVWYLNSKIAVSNIEKFTNNQAKYIVCLRNPVELAVSLHNQHKNTGLENIIDFQVAWNLSEYRVKDIRTSIECGGTNWLNYKKICLLGEQVERLLKTVNRDRIHFVFFEDLKNNPKETYNRIIHFLGLREHEKREFTVENRSLKIRNNYIKELLVILKIIKIKTGLPIKFGLLNKIDQLNKKVGNYPPIDPEFIKEMKEYFYKDLVLLEKLVDKDLTSWKI